MDDIISKVDPCYSSDSFDDPFLSFLLPLGYEESDVEVPCPVNEIVHSYHPQRVQQVHTFSGIWIVLDHEIYEPKNNDP